MNIRFDAMRNYSTQGLKTSPAAQKAVSGDVKAQGFEFSKNDVVSIKADASDVAAAKVRSTVAANVNSLSSADKINALKASIADGSYFVSSEDIADKILERLA
ncbi:MAG: flagellar biosynthesis anti-sigma factor FlgM [Ruminococcus sp.]|nr:flagellar biosynthesis anti-sigma factor FlgM [Ruminococcus sp.]